MKEQGAIVGLLASFHQLVQEPGSGDNEGFIDFDVFSAEGLCFGLQPIFSPSTGMSGFCWQLFVYISGISA